MIVVVVDRGGIMFLWLFFWGGVVKRRLLSCCLYGEVSLFMLVLSIFILCWAGLVERYCVNVFLSWTIWVSPFMVSESFSMYCSLGCHLCSLRVCIKPSKDLLAFIVCGEKTGVIMIGLILYIT